MKSIIYKSSALLFLLGVVVLFDGCKKTDLDLLPHGPTEQVYFTQESDFTKAIIGAYAKMNDFYWYSDNNGSYGGTGSEANMILLPGDDITCSDRNPFEIFGPLNATNELINDLYNTCYQIIYRSNVVLAKIATVAPGVYVTPNLSNYHKGEGLFLRGYANYLLWNYYGTAPVDTVRATSSSQFYPHNSKGTELLDQAISDFTEAAALLPASWDPQNTGRATKNAANGFLGKCLVFRGSWNKNTADYSAALAAFGKISGVSLVAKFDDNFAFDRENNSESLFEYQAAAAQGFDNVWLPNDFDANVGNASVYWGFYSGKNQYGQAQFVGTAKLNGLFDNADPRKVLTIDSNNIIQKYWKRDKLDGVGVGSLNNPRILRYADVLLLEAEATLQSGGSTATAIGFINQVRQRARNMVSAGTFPADLDATVTDKTQIMQWIMDERLRELAGEGQRWFDIRRWNQEGLITLNNQFFSCVVPGNMAFQPKHIFFPLPDGELNINTNMKQNPGY